MVETNTPQNSIEEPNRSVSLDYILMLCVPLTVAIFNHGFVAIFNSVLSIITCMILTSLGRGILHSEISTKSRHSIIIGISVALLLPASAPWWMIVLTSAFAMGVCVLPFGNPEKTPFIPSVTAICFAVLCWSDEFYNYSELGDSLGKMLLYGNSINGNLVAVLEVLVGNVPSAMGTGCILALIGTFIYLLIRRPRDCIAPLCFLITICVMAALFPRISTGRVLSVIMELCSGAVFFGAIFFMSLPNIAPKRTIAKAVWGFASGIICMLIRYVSPLEESAYFGFVIACAISDYFDNLPLTFGEKKKIKALEPYIEIETAPTLVPEEVLNEIPDAFTVKIADETEEIEASANKPITFDSESLGTVIAEENALNNNKAPFIMGGDSDE